jgi:leucine dehydrogenase
VVSAIHATCAHLFGSDGSGGSGILAGRTIAIVGLGHVGGELARMLTAEGARLTVTDTDPSRRALADQLGATWTTPDRALTTPVDVLVPAAVGGMLTADLVPRLRCEAIVGPANNQLAADSVADLLRHKGICWVPDYVASAGGVAYAVSRELDGADRATAAAAVRRIGATVTDILTAADRESITPHRAALRLATDRLAGRGSEALSATM